MLRHFLNSKIHRATVTDANLNDRWRIFRKSKYTGMGKSWNP